MAKKPKTDVEPKFKLTFPSEDQINKAVDKLARLKKSARSASGILGEETNKLAENQHFDKKALSMIRSLDEMTDERFAITWPHIKKYAEARDFDKRAKKQLDRFEKEELEAKVGDDKKAGEAGSGDDKVRVLRPARQVEPA